VVALSEERYAAIIDEAIKLFQKKNYHGTSMQDIAEAVGMYRGSLYHYINSKEEILYRIVERALSEGMAALLKIQKEDCPPAEKLGRLIECHIQYSVKHKAELAIMLEDAKHLSDEWQKQIRQVQKRYEIVFQDAIKEGIQKGEFKDLDVKIVNNAIFGMTNWMYRWYNVDGKLSYKEITSIFLELILRGLLKKEER